MLSLGKISRKKICRRNNKRGLSEVVGYVLLITIAIALSVMVYGWLKFRVAFQEEKQCPTDLSLIVKNYSASDVSLELALQNKGLFTVDGFVVRVNNRSGSDIGVYNIDDVGSALEPGAEIVRTYEFTYRVTGPLSFIEVQPFILDKGERVLCSQSVKKKLPAAV